jgi:hypothetical protein
MIITFGLVFFVEFIVSFKNSIFRLTIDPYLPNFTMLTEL